MRQFAFSLMVIMLLVQSASIASDEFYQIVLWKGNLSNPTDFIQWSGRESIIAHSGAVTIDKLVDRRFVPFGPALRMGKWVPFHQHAGSISMRVGPFALDRVGESVLVAITGPDYGHEYLCLLETEREGYEINCSDKFSIQHNDDVLSLGNLSSVVYDEELKSAWVSGETKDGVDVIAHVEMNRPKDKELGFPVSFWASAQLGGIEAKTPMSMVVNDQCLYVLYAGTFGQSMPDGYIVCWDIASKNLVQHWSVPEIINPVELLVSQCDGFVVVGRQENGVVAHVELDEDKTVAGVSRVFSSRKLVNPIGARWGVDGCLYVVDLGYPIDEVSGSIFQLRMKELD